MLNDCNPVVVGGSGGSGTRVFAMVCMAAGYDMGTRLNNSNDALDFSKFYDGWINPYLLRQQAPLSSYQIRSMEEEFHKCVLKFRSSIRHSGKWGWKNPRSMFMLPFFDSYFPRLRFIHVVRDGRDMAYSKNQNQLRKHGLALLGREHKEIRPAKLSIAFWNKANMAVAKYGEEVMDDRYIRVRFEDMCFEPVASLKLLSDFLEVQFEVVSKIMDRLRVPDSIGSSRNMPEAEQAELLDFGRPGLEYFGYLDT